MKIVGEAKNSVRVSGIFIGWKGKRGILILYVRGPSTGVVTRYLDAVTRHWGWSESNTPVILFFRAGFATE